jgi:hypothetical protein
MRVTSELWVSALMRRVFGAGGFAAVVRRGSAEAGAIFLIARGRMGEVSLYGPAPQTSYDAGRPDERRFQELSSGADERAVALRMEKEIRFDPDVWLVELELSGQAAEDLVSVIKPSD